MNRRLVIPLLTLGAFALSACSPLKAVDLSKSGSGGLIFFANPYGTCDRKNIPTYNLCSEVVGADYNDPAYLTILQSSCESTGGTYSTNNCDRTMSVGGCIIAPGQTNEAHISYYSPEYTAQSAQAACLASPGGVFFP